MGSRDISRFYRNQPVTSFTSSCSHPGARAELIRLHSSSHPHQIQIYCAHGNKNIVCSLRLRVTLSLLRPTTSTHKWLFAAASVTRRRCILNTLSVGGIFQQQSGLLMSWEESPDQKLQAGKPILPGALQRDYTATTRWAAPLIWTQLSLLCLLKSFPSHENVITCSQRSDTVF